LYPSSKEGTAFPSANPGLASRIVKNLLTFCSTLKTNGINVTVTEVINLFELLPSIDVTNRVDFYLASRTALVKRAEDYPKFDVLFKYYWKLSLDEVDDIRERERKGDLERGKQSTVFFVEKDKAYNFSGDLPDRDAPERAKLVTYSAFHTKRKGMFDDLVLRNYSRQKRTIKTLRRYFATLPGRRFEYSQDGDFDFKRTIRSNLIHGGDLLKVARRRNRISKAKLVILCDVSGSMEGYTTDLLLTLQNFCKSSCNTEVFAFSTDIARLTDYFRYLSLRKALATISERIDLWGSGTKIGYCLRMFNSRFRGLVDNRTVVVVISDGWDIGDIDVLRAELSKIHSNAAALIWLNPLADQPGFEPSTAGMKTSLNYVDLMGSTSILNDAGKLRKLLGKSIMMPMALLKARK
jgi:uncharacterized protein with von Willebrand factor type A (vWA) domain